MPEAEILRRVAEGTMDADEAMRRLGCTRLELLDRMIRGGPGRDGVPARALSDDEIEMIVTRGGEGNDG